MTDRAPRPPETHEFVPDDYFRRLDPDAVFATPGPLEIDLGCGDGSFLLAMAERFPERRFLGVERLLGRVRKVSRRARRSGLENLRLLRLESRYTVEWLLPPGSVSRFHLLCPDPWPKARHHRRRLFQREFLEAAGRALEPNGEFLFKTDHPGYFEWAEEVAGEIDGLERLDWPEEAFFYPKTDFQVQWEAQGRTLQVLRLRRPV